MTRSAKVIALCVGRPAPLPGGKISSIDKHAVEGVVRIGRLGLDADTQSDREHHGGKHMAVHQYPADHYRHWCENIPEVEPLARPGAFGENIHATGLTETDVFIGDRLRLGTALLEVSMGRQPCSTLEQHFQRKDMVRRIIANHRCGWYYRVLEEGSAQAGDTLDLVERAQLRWNIDRVFALLFDPASEPRPGDLQDLVSLPALAPAWKAKVTAKLRN